MIKKIYVDKFLQFPAIYKNKIFKGKALEKCQNKGKVGNSGDGNLDETKESKNMEGKYQMTTLGHYTI